MLNRPLLLFFFPATVWRAVATNTSPTSPQEREDIGGVTNGVGFYRIRVTR
ncbi:MAG: hypothetical protein HN919_16000 [Verrucomicrobia bacterium]|nr:hypothetical protein [Verrucomicrobiota bacterium]